MSSHLRRIGKYQLIDQIGVGGFGEVFKGFDPYIKRPGAIKALQYRAVATLRQLLQHEQLR